jgi:hypothetical protein
MSDIVAKYERFDSDGLELVVDTASGKAYASLSAAARMLGISKQAISKKKADNQIDVINAEIETDGGMQGVNLIDSETLYDMAFEYNLPLAKKMGAAGANVYMLSLAGYKASIESKVPQTYGEALIEAGKLAIENERLIKESELKNAQIEILEAETERQAEIIDELFDYSSIIRIAKYNGCDEKAFNWRSLKAASVVLKLEIKQAPCSRFVTKNLYHHDAWRLAYPGYRMPETTTLVISEIPKSL